MSSQGQYLEEYCDSPRKQHMNRRKNRISQNATTSAARRLEIGSEAVDEVRDVRMVAQGPRLVGTDRQGLWLPNYGKTIQRQNRKTNY